MVLPYDLKYTNLVPTIDMMLEAEEPVVSITAYVDVIEGTGFNRASIEFFSSPSFRAALQVLKLKNIELFDENANSFPEIKNINRLNNIEVKCGEMSVFPLDITDKDGDDVKLTIVSFSKNIYINEGELVVDARKWRRPTNLAFMLNINDGNESRSHQFVAKISD
ncbi:hypothetical protein [Vibrio campbellii]|uniref:hypothetical protein n=1 Tax=Vibrio campbellii TaxID=680 RepID=UPI001315A3D8|nr:hypothetical protein [Vibrio campbellii]